MKNQEKIPTRIIFNGDINSCKKYIGIGKKRYSDLVQSMKFQGLKTGSNTLEIGNDVFIKTSSGYGLSTIEIFAPYAEQNEEISGVFDCPCTPCMGHAIIIAVQNGSGDSLCVDSIIDDCEDDYTNTELIEGARYYYKILLCTKESETEEELYQAIPSEIKVKSLGWERYNIGQKVYVMFYPNSNTPTEKPKADCLFELLNSGEESGIEELFITTIIMQP